MILGEDVKNKLEIKVQNTGEVFTFYYRIPDIDEWIDFNQKMVKAFKSDPESLTPEIVKIKIKAATKILEGIEDGQFEIMIDGEKRPSGPEALPSGAEDPLGRSLSRSPVPLRRGKTCSRPRLSRN